MCVGYHMRGEVISVLSLERRCHILGYHGTYRLYVTVLSPG